MLCWVEPELVHVDKLLPYQADFGEELHSWLHDEELGGHQVAGTQTDQSAVWVQQENQEQMGTYEREGRGPERSGFEVAGGRRDGPSLTHERKRKSREAVCCCCVGVNETVIT